MGSVEEECDVDSWCTAKRDSCVLLHAQTWWVVCDWQGRGGCCCNVYTSKMILLLILLLFTHLHLIHQHC